MYIVDTDKLIAAQNAARGTDKFDEFRMETQEVCNGKWIFVGYTVVTFDRLIVHRSGTGLWLYSGNEYSQRRYKVTGTVAEVLGL